MGSGNFYQTEATHLSGKRLSTVQTLWVLAVTLIWFGAGLFAQIYRFRRIEESVQRQQTKWVVFGFLMFTVGMFAISLPILLVSALRQPGSELMTYLLIEIPFVRSIDRRFYRQKYDEEKLVMSFGASLWDEAEIDQVATRLLQATPKTLQPYGTELWMVDIRGRRFLKKVSQD